MNYKPILIALAVAVGLLSCSKDGSLQNDEVSIESSSQSTKSRSATEFEESEQWSKGFNDGIGLGFKDAVHFLTMNGNFACQIGIQYVDGLNYRKEMRHYWWDGNRTKESPMTTGQFHTEFLTVSSCGYIEFRWHGMGSHNEFAQWRIGLYDGLNQLMDDPLTTSYYHGRYMGQKVGVDWAYMQALSGSSFEPPFPIN